MEHEERGEAGPELDDEEVHELLQKEKLRIFQDSKKVLRKSTGLLIGHLRHIQNEGKNYHAIGRIPGEIQNMRARSPHRSLGPAIDVSPIWGRPVHRFC
jgi:hypothetical protein